MVGDDTGQESIMLGVAGIQKLALHILSEMKRRGRFKKGEMWSDFFKIILAAMWNMNLGGPLESSSRNDAKRYQQVRLGSSGGEEEKLDWHVLEEIY